MRFKDIIALRVSDFYNSNPPTGEQIAHTMAVASLTRQIALMQRLEDRRTDLLESAAWLHDIGCPDAVRKYGNSKPVYQMEEGERLVGEWFASDGDSSLWKEARQQLSPEERQWLARVVGSHHQQKPAIELHFEPLFEADLIVNIKEGYYGRSQAGNLFDKMMLSDEGRRMFRMYLS